MSPGTTPAMNILPTEIPVQAANTIAGTLGGMMGPIIDYAPVMARLKSSSYPFSFIA